MATVYFHKPHKSFTAGERAILTGDELAFALASGSAIIPSTSKIEIPADAYDDIPEGDLKPRGDEPEDEKPEEEKPEDEKPTIIIEEPKEEQEKAEE